MSSRRRRTARNPEVILSITGAAPIQNGSRPSRLRAFTVSLAKNLGWTAATGGASAAAWQASPALGGMVMFAGAFAQMCWSYRREWRLLWLTAILPALAAGGAWGLQLSVSRAAPHPAVLLGAAFAGLVVGALRGRAHDVFVREGRVYAKRTRLFLALWAVCYGVTQVCAVARAEGLTAAGLAGGAFTSAMLAGVALILIRKSRGRGLPVATAATVALTAVVWTASAGGPARADGISALTL